MGTKSKIIGGGNLKGGTIKGATTYKTTAKEITPEVLENVKNEYIKFVENTYHSQKLVDNYVFMQEQQLVVEFFACTPFPDSDVSSTVIDIDGNPMRKPQKRIVFSIAKVLALSPDINDGLGADDPRILNIGDIICLRDFDVATMVNPMHEVINSAKAMNKSNAQVTTKTPDKYYNNIGNKVRNIFIPNKLDLRTHYFDKYIFEVGRPEIRFKPKDPMLLVESMLPYELEENKG